MELVYTAKRMDRSEKFAIRWAARAFESRNWSVQSTGIGHWALGCHLGQLVACCLL